MEWKVWHQRGILCSGMKNFNKPYVVEMEKSVIPLPVEKERVPQTICSGLEKEFDIAFCSGLENQFDIPFCSGMEKEFGIPFVVEWKELDIQFVEEWKKFDISITVEQRG